MDNEQCSHTSTTLLVQVRDSENQQAWSVFVKRYGPRILHWCRSKGAAPEDREEITQQVLVKLVSKMKTFRYDPSEGSFRGWLKTVTVNTWKDFLRDNARFRRVASGFDPDELAAAVQDEYDRELFELAQESVRQKVDEKSWQAFQLRAFEEWPSKQVATRLGMTVAAVDMAKSRVQRMIKSEIDQYETHVSC